MGKINFDQDKCIGCGACCNIAQDNFTFNDEGKASMINDTLTDEAIEASEMCPTQAITIDNSCNCEENCNCENECNCTNENCCCEDCDCSTECSCGDECNCTEECNCGCK